MDLFTLNSFGVKFQMIFVICFVFLTNYQLKESLYVKLTYGMSNSVDPDESAHYESTLFSKVCYHRLWQ